MIKLAMVCAVVVVLIASGCTSSPSPATPEQPSTIQGPAPTSDQVLDQQIDSIPQENVDDLEGELTGAILAQ